VPVDETEDIPPGVLVRLDYEMTPNGSGQLVHGWVGDEIYESTLDQGEIVLRTPTGTEYLAEVQPDGSFSVNVDEDPSTQMDVFFRGHPGFSTNTMTWLRDGMPANLGRTMTSVGVYEPDTTSVDLGSLAYAGGHHVLMFSNASADNDTILNTIRNPVTNKGVRPWTEDTRMYTFLALNQDTGEPLSEDRLAMLRQTAQFYMDRNGLPYGSPTPTISFIDVDTTSMQNLPGTLPERMGKAFIHENDASPSNAIAPPHIMGIWYTLSNTRVYDTSNKKLLEQGEAEQMYDVDGSNGHGFKLGPGGYIIDLSSIGQVARSATHTYGEEDFKRPLQ